MLHKRFKCFQQKSSLSAGTANTGSVSGLRIPNVVRLVFLFPRPIGSIWQLLSDGPGNGAFDGVFNFMPIDRPPLYLPGKYRSLCGITYCPGPGVGLRTGIGNRSVILAARPSSEFGMQYAFGAGPMFLSRRNPTSCLIFVPPDINVDAIV